MLCLFKAKKGVKIATFVILNRAMPNEIVWIEFGATNSPLLHSYKWCGYTFIHHFLSQQNGWINIERKVGYSMIKYYI